MPKLWSETIEAHRREVRDAIMGTTAELAGEHGPLNVSMTQVAEATGIGRATLYKYFDSVETILHAWHERQISDHLALLTELAGREGSPLERLEAVLKGYTSIHRARDDHHRTPHGMDLSAFLHRDHQLAPAERRLQELVRDLLGAAADAGQIRSDIPPSELTIFCLHALDAASELPSEAAVERLTEVTLNGLQG
ncbi:MAG: TetR/AcrR family transcriptional regulator [Actinobacteria bacterium]|nr:TetR/AcrR family transcriptional regulator [Actinomycetota bacterium]